MEKTNNSGIKSLVKYLLAGIATAAVVYIVIALLRDDRMPPETKKVHVWSQEGDSLFVKNCYEKYKPQIKDDMARQETMKSYCRCMLEKIKSEYDEKDVFLVKDSEIKQWDTECRAQISK